MQRFARFDILSAAPSQLIRYDPDGLSIRVAGLWHTEAVDPFDYLDQRLKTLDATESELPFSGGLIGHWSYDLGRVIENLPSQAQADIDFPWMQVGLYLWAIVIDHQDKRSWLVAQPSCSKILLDKLSTLITRHAGLSKADRTRSFSLTKQWTANLTKAEYRQALEKVDGYIQAGDCYQINFSQRFSSNYSGDPWEGYKQLREQAPTPFSAYLEYETGSILCFSPERFIKVSESGSVETRPIKGTRPRGKDQQEDEALVLALKNAPKDRAENLMIVDLLRNDLSRACRPGSVSVPELFEIETYPNVHHLVSSVQGSLESSQSPLTLLRSTFPGGSITGAPKIRAMEIIDELEPERRSVYCGSIGYISASGRMDTNICIRTLLCIDNRIYCWAGGGIVADSDVEDEFQETLNKVNNLLSALGAGK